MSDHDQDRELRDRQFRELLFVIIRKLDDIVRLLTQPPAPKPRYARLVITPRKGKGKLTMSNTVLKVGDVADAVLHDFLDAAMTQEVPPVGPVSYASDDPTVATVDPVSGMINAVAPSKLDGNGNPIPVTITGTDAGAKDPNGNPLSASDTVTDSPLPVQVAQFAKLVITPRAAGTAPGGTAPVAGLAAKQPAVSGVNQ